MVDGIRVSILGDFGPFSRMGKSIGYQLEVGNSRYLIDCGSPLFQQLGGRGLKTVDGLIITHCHDDHKRWFTDLALFNMYSVDVTDRVFLLATEEVHNGLVSASMPALQTSLSPDSKRIIDIPYEDYVDSRTIGPRAKFRIVSLDNGSGARELQIRDSAGNPVAPELAKIIINRKTGRPRMLFRDPECGEWVEPESFYALTSEVFYEKDRNVFKGPEGFTIEAVKAPVWHGISGIGLRVKTDNEILVFSSDTAHDIDVWRQLCTEKRRQRLGMSPGEFGPARIIYGDINDYIERTWSEKRYQEAMTAFDNAVVIHDISTCDSVVHTDYEKLDRTNLKKASTILTHSPDTLTSEWALCRAGKSFRIIGENFFEEVGEELLPMDADLYHKEQGRYFAGYRSEAGGYEVYEKDGLLSFGPAGEGTGLQIRYRVDLYEDISGRYFPKLEDPSSVYFERTDGKVELLTFNANGSAGRVVEDQRMRLSTTADTGRPAAEV